MRIVPNDAKGTVFILAVGTLVFGHLHAAAPQLDTHPSVAGPAQSRTGTIEGARQLLAKARAGNRREGERLFGILLDGYMFDYELELGDGARLLVLSCKLHGGLLLFGNGGALEAVREAPEFVSAQAIDLDGDRQAEVLTEEVDDSGTGVRQETYRLYRLAKHGIQEIWSGEGYVLKMPASGNVAGRVERVGFVRLEPAGMGLGPRLVHIVYDAVAGTSSTRVYELRGGALEASDTPVGLAPSRRGK